jgi:hypothetical protein
VPLFLEASSCDRLGLYETFFKSSRAFFTRGI